MTSPSNQVSILRDVADAIVGSGYALYAADSKKRIDVFLQDVDLEREKFQRANGCEPTRLQLAGILGVTRSQLSRLIKRRPCRTRQPMRCDVCGREKMYKYVRPCGCGGWMRPL